MSLNESFKKYQQNGLLSGIGGAVGGLVNAFGEHPQYSIAAQGNGFGFVDKTITGGYGNSVGTAGVNVGASLMNAGLSSGNLGLILAGGIAGTAGTAVNLLGGGANTEKLEKANRGNSYLNNFTSNAESFDDIQGPASVENIGNIYRGGLVRRGWAKRKNEEAQLDRANAQAFADNSVTNNIDNLIKEQNNSLLANYHAFGGPLMPIEGVLDYNLAQRRLQIMEDRNNSKSSQLAFGGSLHTNGSDWNNGITIIGNGGTHEQSPIDGVPMGVAPDGVPNLVEEGEVIYNDYVYSNRLKVPKAVRQKYKLRGTKDITFAEAAKQVQKESEERPNDSISRRTLDDIMSKLMTEQETIRQKREARRLSKKYGLGGLLYAHGGPIGIMYSGDDDNPNVLITPKSEWNALSSVLNNATFPKANTSGFIPYSRDITDEEINKRRSSPDYIAYTKYINDNWDTKAVQADLLALDTAAGGNKLFDAKGEQTPGAKEYWLKARKSGPWGFYSLTPDRVGNEPVAPASIAKPDDESVTRSSTRGLPAWEWGGENSAYPRVANPGSHNIAGYPATDSQGEGNGDGGKGGNKWWDASYLRYAPVLGAGIGVLTDALGLTNKPDYTYADDLMAVANNTLGSGRDVSFNPIGDYMRYTPLDRLFYANQLGAQAAGNRRAILNSSGLNRGQAIAGLLAADYNAQNSLGNLYRQAEEYNLGQREKVATFNRATNMFNSEGFLKADIANAERSQKNASLLINAASHAASLKAAADAQANANRSANITNFLQGLGDIGWETVNRRMVNDNPAYYYDVKNGRIVYNPDYYRLSKKDKEVIDKYIKDNEKDVTFANGGYLTIKRRRR